MNRRSDAELPRAARGPSEPPPAPREGGRRSVTRRVTISYLVVTLAFSLVTAWNVFALRAATQEAELMRSGYLPLALALRDAVLGQETWSVQLNHVTAAKNPAVERVWFDSWLTFGRPRAFLAVRDALSLAFGKQSEELQSLGHRLEAETTEIESALEADRELIGKLFDALQSRDAALAQKEVAQNLRDELMRRSQEGRRRLIGLEREVKSSVDGLLDDARARERLAARLLWASASFTVLVGLWVAWNARRLLAPLGAVTERARAVTRGDLTPHQLVASNDEIGELAATFESMVAAIARANAELLSSERLAAIGKMAAQVTHEVRNPLSSLALNVELLEEELGEPQGEVAALLKAVKLEVERLILLSEKYLSLARRSRPDFQEEDLGAVVSEAVASAQPELAQHEIKSQLQIQEGLPPAALDEAQIRQVMLNLIRNAREAMSEGGELVVGVRALGSPAAQALGSTPAAQALDGAPQVPDTLEISVADSGRGIDEQTRQHLFEPFFTTKRNGNGLGLAITQEIVEAHGGKIRCERRVPRGTRFVIELPLRPPAQLAERSQTPPPPELSERLS